MIIYVHIHHLGELAVVFWLKRSLSLSINLFTLADIPVVTLVAEF